MDDGLQRVSDIPKAWRDVFDLIRVALPGTIMAGGCLRDRDLGVKVKDIDLFVPEDTGKGDDLNTIVKILLDLGAVSATVDGDKMYPTGVDNHVVGVVDVKFDRCPLPIQLVVGDWGRSIPDLFERFDYGICMIAFDGRDIHRDPNYWMDRKAKAFRICSRRSRRAFQQSVERYVRLKQKYPSWKFHLGHLHVEYGGSQTGFTTAASS